MGNRVHVFDTATLQGTKDRMLFFAGFGEPLKVTIQSCLIDTGREKILVDTGIAAPDAPYLGPGKRCVARGWRESRDVPRNAEP
jgi:hypothetical protein